MVLTGVEIILVQNSTVCKSVDYADHYQDEVGVFVGHERRYCTKHN